MENVLLVIHLILALAIILVVLLQRSEGGGLVSTGGGMGGLMGTRSTANLLTRTTGLLAVAFFCTSLLLAIVANNRAPDATLMDSLSAAPATEKLADPETKTEEGGADTVPAVPISE